MEEKLDLYQTYWEGTLFYRSSGVENKLDIKVTFESTIVGEYAIEDMNSNIPYSSKSIFQYEVKDKIINISDGYKNILVGNGGLSDMKMAI